MTDALRLTATPANIRLCQLEEIGDPGARNFVIQLRAGYFHGFVVRRADVVKGYVDRCPHMGMPLAQQLDDYLTPGGDFIACSWHGAVFEPETGRCVGGPCLNETLLRWPVSVVGDEIRTALENPAAPIDA